jgi:hypothetical protein
MTPPASLTHPGSVQMFVGYDYMQAGNLLSGELNVDIDKVTIIYEGTSLD